MALTDLGREQATGYGFDFGADRFPVQQRVFQPFPQQQRVHTVSKKYQVAVHGIGLAQAGGQFTPRRMVVADGIGQQRQVGKRQQQFMPAFAVGMALVTFGIVHQPPVHGGR